MSKKLADLASSSRNTPAPPPAIFQPATQAPARRAGMMSWIVLGTLIWVGLGALDIIHEKYSLQYLIGKSSGTRGKTDIETVTPAEAAREKALAAAQNEEKIKAAEALAKIEIGTRLAIEQNNATVALGKETAMNPIRSKGTEMQLAEQQFDACIKSSVIALETKANQCRASSGWPNSGADCETFEIEARLGRERCEKTHRRG